MTETATLPGLETVDPPVPEGEPKRWIERGPQKRLMLFSGSSNRELAERIAETLGVELGEVRLKTFANGEKSAPREPITAKLVADALEVAGVDRVVAMDLHAGQIQGFFNVPVDHMTALQLFAQYYRDKGLHGEGIVAVSPDPGRAKMARRFGQMLEGDLAILNKTRPEHDKAAVTEVIGDVQGKIAIMSDDMIVTGGTLIAGAEALLGAGALEVYACATHGLFPGDAFEQLAASKITQVTVTNTVPVDPIKRPDKIDVLPVTTLLAETIMNVFSDDSVSAIFAGENQLF